MSPTQVLTIVWSQVCPRRCQCPKEPPECLPGVPLMLDDCMCCLVCARQRGQVCSDMNPCDTRKGLQCEYTVHGRTGICAGEWTSPIDCVQDAQSAAFEYSHNKGRVFLFGAFQLTKEKRVFWAVPSIRTARPSSPAANTSVCAVTGRRPACRTVTWT